MTVKELKGKTSDELYEKIIENKECFIYEQIIKKIIYNRNYIIIHINDHIYTNKSNRDQLIINYFRNDGV